MIVSELVFSRLPVNGVITGTFGQTEGYGYPHRGIDFGVPVGTEVYAPASGYAVAFTNDGSFGWKAICLQHPDTGLYSLYAHLSQSLVKVGDWVSEGELLGRSGNEGVSSGPHLHWQVCTNTLFPVDITYSRDPLAYVLKEEDLEAIRQLQQRMDRMEAVVAGNGFDAICRPGTEDLFPAGTAVVPEGMDGAKIRLTGPAAVEYCKRRGFSLALAIEMVQG